MTVTRPSLPVSPSDRVNRQVLSVSEDRLSGFHERPFSEIAARSGVDTPVVIERVKAMLAAGTVRRVRQTLNTGRLAAGALVAWKVPPERLQDAFDYMWRQDPFSGHVVIRSTDRTTPGAEYRLWTTLKVPQSYSLEKHCDHLARTVGAESYRAMTARALFVLGVGHARRRSMVPGAKSASAVEPLIAGPLRLDERLWRVLEVMKRELTVDEVGDDVWSLRAAEASLGYEDFVAAARDLERLGVLGRFSTFLEHVKPVADGERVTRYNALFHWAVPAGRELEAGREVGRFHILTHAYWREAGPEFGNVNLMAVTHGMERDRVLLHKAAIDEHLRSAGIAVSYTNVFWGGRSEIKPSEVMPAAYRAWCEDVGLDPESMRAAQRA